MRTEIWDAVVVGTGLAGMTAALALKPLKTLLITKTDKLESGSTPWAQGGIAFPVDEADIPSHIHDTLEAGAQAGDPQAVTFLIRQAPLAQAWLEELGFPFDLNPDGTYDRGQEGSHSQRRILHAGGDSTGAILSQFFSQKVAQASHLTLRTQVFAAKVSTDAERTSGIWLWDDQGPLLAVTRRVILATGGWGQVFPRTTAPAESTGDGAVLALRCGADLRDPEMIQFHPTGLDTPAQGQVPLLTEALRGEGAPLVTSRFNHEDLTPLPIPHPLGALGPRDTVARAVYEYRQRGWGVWLDVRRVPRLEQHFPTACSLARQSGFNPLQAPLPVTPVAHYVMGGVKTNLEGRTKVQGLYVIGEAASSGVHGANRLASNSLLECLVFGLSSARSAKELQHTPGDQSSLSPENPLKNFAKAFPQQRVPVEACEQFKAAIQNLTYQAGGPVREGQELLTGLQELKHLQQQWRQAAVLPLTEETPRKEMQAFWETENLFVLAQKILEGALARTTSLGAHFRRDSL